MILNLNSKRKRAQKAFDFLIGAFVEDYMQRRLPVEVSGWRTLMDVVKHGRISRRMVYGNGGYHGRAISELERRGLVEIRIFPGERGRGGRILKLRVFYEKETIRRSIDETSNESWEKVIGAPMASIVNFTPFLNAIDYYLFEISFFN